MAIQHSRANLDTCLKPLLGQKSCILLNMDSTPVTCDFDEKLIVEIEKHRCLYDPNRVDFKDQMMKENAWKAVAALWGCEGGFDIHFTVGPTICYASACSYGWGTKSLGVWG